MRPILALAVATLALAACTRERPPEAPAAAASLLTTVGDSASVIEGIATHQGMLYVADWKDGAIYRVDPVAPAPVRVGRLPTVPGQWILGLRTDRSGNLYAAIPDSGLVLRVAGDRLGAADFDPLKDVTRFVTGAAGANALAFDRRGHLWISGGDQGALYHVGPDGGKAVLFAKGYAPMAADTTLPVRGYVVNGVGFDAQGAVYTLNTGTGEVTRLTIAPDDTPDSITVLARDPRLVGADGLQVGEDGALWIACNFRNALVRVGPDGTIAEVAASTPTGGNALRFPAELVRVGDAFYLTNLNFPVGANAGQPVPGASIAVVRLGGATPGS